jgi:membrane associated rhomboid family serine protease
MSNFNYSYNAVGASGAVSAVVFSSILFIPLQGITFIFFPFFSIPAFIFGALYLAYEYYMSKRPSDGIGHDAHFAGAIYGIIFTLIVIPESFSIFISQIADFFTNF